MSYVALTEAQARRVRKMKASWPGVSTRQLARAFGTSPGTIRNVLAGYPPYGTRERVKRTYVGTGGSDKAGAIDSAA